MDAGADDPVEQLKQRARAAIARAGAARPSGAQLRPEPRQRAPEPEPEPEPAPAAPRAAEAVAADVGTRGSSADVELEQLKLRLAQKTRQADQKRADQKRAALSRVEAMEAEPEPLMPARPAAPAAPTRVPHHRQELDAGRGGCRAEPTDVDELDIPSPPAWAAPPETGAAKRFCELILAVLVGLLLLAILLPALGTSLVAALLNLLAGLLMSRNVHLIVNTLYGSRLGVVREWGIRAGRRCCRCCRERDAHSRPLRVDIPLPPLTAPPPGAEPAAARRECSVHTIAMFSDNYAYLIVDKTRERPYPCALVDPADAQACLDELERLLAEYGGEGRPLEETFRVEAILTTHRHWDHAWGNRRLTDGSCLQPPPTVFGGAHEQPGVSCCSVALEEGSTDCVVGTLPFEILHTPYHTAGNHRH